MLWCHTIYTGTMYVLNFVVVVVVCFSFIYFMWQQKKWKTSHPIFVLVLGDLWTSQELHILTLNLKGKYCFISSILLCILFFSWPSHYKRYVAIALGTLRSNDATTTRTSLKKWICVLSVFIVIIPTYLLCQM